MPPAHDFRVREIPFSQLPQPLSLDAESGAVGRSLGAFPHRQHQPAQALRLHASSVKRVYPLPPSSHPWPQPPTAA